MKTRTASLFVCHDLKDFRALKEMEGSGNSCLNIGNATKISVSVFPATEEVLQNELKKIGIVVNDLSTVREIAAKYVDELCCLEDGVLAWDETPATREGFFQIVKK